MKQIIQSNYSHFFMGGLILTLIYLWVCGGPNHPDEHFQILEFANYKMGKSNPIDLPWEFSQKIRTSFLISVVYLAGKTMVLLHFYNPFHLIFILRFLTGLISWFVISKCCLLFVPQLKTIESRSLFILVNLFGFVVPFLNIRFTPEHISGIFLLSALYLILATHEKITHASLQKRYVTAGLLFGMALFMRIQIAPAILGFFSWLILVNKTQWKYIGLLCASITVAIVINIFIDSWFYNEWMFTPFNYFYANIVLHIAEQYGTEPWWYYLISSKTAFPLMILMGIGIANHKKDPLVWVVVPFMIVHSCIAHKELRFLSPIVFMLVYVGILGYEYFFTEVICKKTNRHILHKISVLSIFLLLSVFTPKRVSRSVPEHFYKFLYDHVNDQSTPVLTLNKNNLYMANTLNINFFKNKNINPITLNNLKEFNEYMQIKQPERVFLISGQYFNFKLPTREYKIKRIFPFPMLNHVSHRIQKKILHYIRREPTVWSIVKTKHQKVGRMYPSSNRGRSVDVT